MGELFCPHLLLVALVTILPGTEQFPVNVVFQPYTYQLSSPGSIAPDLSPVNPYVKTNILEKTEDQSSQLICKKIQNGGAFLRVSPSTQSKQLFLMPFLQSGPTFKEDARYFVALPTGSDLYPGAPESALGAPAAPLVASLCVTADSPRPFPVLFAPPTFKSDFRSESLGNVVTGGTIQPLMPGMDDSVFKVALRVPVGSGLTLGLNGVPVTIENKSVFGGDPAGNVVIKLHNVTPQNKISEPA